ncbi:MAG TPA: anhydro-N-acetylmuramic acid kinase [Burkholderiaceae bacterium]|nr:anhydro-N-acetylmuramic acid kinase [Burkholderiaceae bacterium]
MTHMLYAGLMSGTSTDGIDGVLADFPPVGPPRIMAQVSMPMPETLRREFLALNSPGDNELERAALAANALAKLYADAIGQLLARAKVGAPDVAAIGAHGQTVRHRPEAGYTIQLNAPAVLAELTGIDVVADFRSRDVAAGGQGAPLVPAFHQALFQCDHPRAVLNLGGIANVTLLAPNEPVRGFDTGPANVLMDMWCQEKTGATYDADGKWAATGHAGEELLDVMVESEPWFRLPPPKSTGRDRFNRQWLARRLAIPEARGMRDNDIQATLRNLTARTVADAIAAHAPQTQDIVVCGGGALNDGLMATLTHYLNRPVVSSAELGVPVQMVEALAFAWLAWAHGAGHAAGLPSVTGARHATPLGARYPA